jgi:aspartokinase-like uncharacterized kinase
MGAGSRPVVVKLGGSFAFSAHLRLWVEALAACAGRVVIAPGGGPFADTVRSAQKRMGFDDSAAHEMALLAVAQYGRALMSFNGLLTAADSIEDIHRDLARGRLPVWMPARMVGAASDISQSWDATSDSMAAWLAGRLGASRLLLVKHVEFQRSRARPDDLVAMGIVDKEFVRHLETSGADVFILGPADHRTAAAAIRDGAPVGIPVG